MKNLTRNSPAVRLYAAWDGRDDFDPIGDLRRFPRVKKAWQAVAVEHERIVAERMTPVVAERDAAIAERDRMRELIDTPINDDWFFGAKIEAVHQQERWGVSHDQGKSPLDWFWLIGYLAQKVTESAINGDIEKAKHHTISTAAALLNWHRHLSVEPAALVQASTIPDVAEHLAAVVAERDAAIADRDFAIAIARAALNPEEKS
jgi:hypothetical protein